MNVANMSSKSSRRCEQIVHRQHGERAIPCFGLGQSVLFGHVSGLDGLSGSLLNVVISISLEGWLGGCRGGKDIEGSSEARAGSANIVYRHVI